MLLVYQPFYISGIENVEKAKGSAFGAMMMFVATFFISLVLWWRDARIKKILQQHARGDYNQVPTHAILDQEYEIDLPATNTFLEEPQGGLTQRRSTYKDQVDDAVVEEEEELESSVPHVPEGQLLPTTHV